MGNSRTGQWIPSGIQDAVFFLLLLVMVLSMPLSSTLISSSQLAMGAFWLLTGQYREKFMRFWNNKPALLFAGIFMVHVAGLLWTEELGYAVFKVLRDKLPMLTLTFLVASVRPISLARAYVLLLAFSFSVTVTSFFGFGIFLSGQYENFRDLSPFISHFQYSLMMVITVFLLPWLVRQISGRKGHMIGAYLVSAWLIFFLFIVSSLQGIISFAGVVAFLFVRCLIVGRSIPGRILAASAVAAVAATVVAVSVYMIKNVSATVEVEPSQLTEKTEEGNAYLHHFDNQLRENGHYVYFFIAEQELRDEWEQVSDYDFEGTDDAGYFLKYTLFRYMASRGLKKDRAGLLAMDEADIRAVENGTTNYLYNGWPIFLIRLHTTFWEIYWYQQTGNPTGHTLSQRLELWKASWVAFKHKPMLGWGTGDVFIAVKYGLETIDSQLENFQMKPHNQYLTFLLALGLAGSLLIMAMYIVFVRKTRAYRYFPFNVFIVVILMAMTGNDPLDVQFGQTIFSFFTIFFGLIYKPGKESIRDFRSLTQAFYGK